MVLLDTNIIIELYKGNISVRDTCEKEGEENLFISSVVAAEFLPSSSSHLCDRI